VTIWTAHEKPDASPVLVKEGFAWGCALFGPVWLAAHRAWIPAAGVLTISLLIQATAAPPAAEILGAGFALLLGFSGLDLIRCSIARRGLRVTQIVSGVNEDEARSRLFDARPDLIERALLAEAP
jgi:hypothetical protein